MSAPRTKKVIESLILKLESNASQLEEYVNSLNHFVKEGLARTNQNHFTFSIHPTFLSLDLLALVSNKNPLLQYSGKTLNAADAAKIDNRDKFFIIYILAQNYLVAYYDRFRDSTEKEDESYVKLFEEIGTLKDGKLKDNLYDRNEALGEKFNESKEILKELKVLVDENYCKDIIFRNRGRDWHQRMEVKGYQGVVRNPTYVFKTGKKTFEIDFVELFGTVLTCFDQPKSNSKSKKTSNKSAISNASASASKDSSSKRQSDSSAISNTASNDRSSSNISDSEGISNATASAPKDSSSKKQSDSSAISNTSASAPNDRSSSNTSNNSEGISNASASASKKRSSKRPSQSTANISKSSDNSDISEGEDEFTGEIDCSDQHGKSDATNTELSDPKDIAVAITTLSNFLQNSHLDGTIQESASSSSSSNIVSTAENNPMKVRQLLFGLLNENHQLKQKEFQVSIELIFRYVSYQQNFSKFFIMCESFPVAFSEGLLVNEKDSVQSTKTRAALIKASEDYLCRLASNLMEFFKQFLLLESTMTSSDLVGKIFPTVTDSQKEKYCAVLDDPSVRRMIHKVSREDQLFIELSSKSNFNSSRHYLFDKLVSKFCNSDIETLRLDESKEYIISIMRNIKLHKSMASEDNIKKITRLVEKYVCKENPLDYRTDVLNHRQLRSSISSVDYSGMESSSSSSNKKQSARSSSDAEAVETDAEDSDAVGDADAVDADAEDSDDGGDADGEDSDDVGDAENAEVEDSDDGVAAVIQDSSTKLGKRPQTAENANVDSEEGHSPKRSKETRSFQSTESSRENTVHVIAYPVLDIEKSPLRNRPPSKVSSSQPSNPAAVRQLPPSLQCHSSPPISTAASKSFNQNSITATVPSPALTTPSANSSFLSARTSPNLDNSLSSTYQREYQILLSVLQKQKDPQFPDQKSMAMVKDSVKFILKSVVQCCDEWSIDLSKDILNVPDNSSSNPLTPAEIAFWMKLWTDYVLSKEDSDSDSDVEMQDAAVVVSSSHSSHSSGLIPSPEVGVASTSGDAIADASAQNVNMQNGASDVSNSHSSGLSQVAVASTSGAASAVVTQPAVRDTPDVLLRIRQVSDRIVGGTAIDQSLVQFIRPTNSAVNVDVNTHFSSCALSMYLYAVRNHVMTREFFLDRPSYRQLDYASYQRHKDFLFLFLADNANFNTDTVSNALGYPPFNGERSVTAVINHMFTRENGYGLNLVPGLALPRKDAEEDPLDSLNAIVQNAVLANIVANPTVDMSVVFIDFLPFDIKSNTAAVIGFPYRLVVKHGSLHFVYQTVGAVYKYIDNGEDRYAVRIVSRGRGRGEYFYFDYFCNYESMDFKARLPKGVRYQFGDIEELKSKDRHQFLFPAEISPGYSKRAKVKYFLEGVVMSLNEGQLTGYSRDSYPNPGASFQHSVSLVDPVYSCCGQMLHAREMRILESTEWLTDEIIYAAILRFMQTTNHDANAEGSPVIIPPAVFVPMVKSLVEQEKNVSSETVNTFSVGYWQGRDYWAHTNLFSRTSWFFAIINYPDNSHWIFLGMHSGQKKYFVNDPLHNPTNLKSLKIVVEAYIDLEAEIHCEEKSIPESGHLKHTAWTYLPSKCQQQNDKSNCGVLSLIAFFRAMTKVIANPGVAAESLAAKWICNGTIDGCTHYRSMLKEFLGENSGAASTYFSQTLPNYITQGANQYN